MTTCLNSLSTFSGKAHRTLAEAEGQTIDAAVRQLLSACGAAIGVMLTLMDDVSVAPGVRLRAAQGILDNVVKLRELRDLEARLSALESTVYGDLKRRLEPVQQ